MVILRSPFSYGIPEDSYHRPPHEVFQESTRQFSNSVALVDIQRNVSFTFLDILLKAGSFAKVLDRDFAFRVGDTIGVYLENRPEFFFIMFGVQALGGIYMGINPSCTSEELAHQLKTGGVKYLVTSQPLLDNVRAAVEQGGYSTLSQVFVYGMEPNKSEQDAAPNKDIFPVTALDRLFSEPTDKFPRPRIDPVTDVSMIFTSSGTTGLPKGVMLNQKVLNWFLKRLPDRTSGFNLTSRDRMLIVLPLFHIAGLGTTLWGLIAGARAYILPKYDPVAFVSAIQTHRISSVFLVPTIMVFLAKDPRPLKYDLSCLRCIGFGAASTGVELLQAIRARYPAIDRLTQFYGMTEAGTFTSVVPNVPIEQIQLASVGMLQPNNELKVISTDDAHRELGAHEVGEICTRNNFRMLGYRNRPEATREVLDPDGWLHSGDIGYFDAAGNLYITDRIKDLIKYKGFQVAPAELEDIIHHHPGVLEVGVAGISTPESQDIGELATAFVVPDKAYADLPSLAHEIEDLVKSKCAPYKHLRGGVIFMDAIPKGPSGKILRRKLRQLAPNLKKSKL